MSETDNISSYAHASGAREIKEIKETANTWLTASVQYNYVSELLYYCTYSVVFYAVANNNELPVFA